MTLEQLRIFIAVAERQHVTEAAHALNLTQSAVSAAIAALEQRHDICLFDRVGRGIALTELGRSFLPEARAVVARAEEAVVMLRDSAGLLRGRLKLVASQTVANYWLPGVMMRFRGQYPGVELQLQIMNTSAACEAVAEGRAELGFIEDRPEVANLLLQPAAEDQMVLVAATDLPIAKLAKASWIMREKGSGTRAILEAALKAAGISDLDIALELPSNEAVRAAVEAGAGISALSASVVAASVELGRLRTLPFPLPPRQFFAIRAEQRHLSRAAEALLKLA